MLLTPVQQLTVDALCLRHAGRRGALLPLLHAIVEELSYIPDATVPLVARALNISRADVHGVLTFYHDFRRVPPGRHVIKLCQAEACQARGAVAVEASLVERLGVAMNATRSDAKVTLEGVYCIGLCPVGPAALVDGRPVARIDNAAVARLAAEVEA